MKRLDSSPEKAGSRAGFALVCDTTGKILAILWPIAGFVALGLEHSVANMYLIPQGWFAGAEMRPLSALVGLAVVTFGNILGGAGGVALSYRFAYLGPRQA